tara:strand:- start:294 stop:1103 length:810 start_codon:yes stop_codon:yes gene_type:complete
MNAIVVQGKFSNNTELILEHYLTTNDCMVILSSYDDTPSVVLEKLSKKFSNFKCVLQPEPKILGKQNRNAQRFSTYRGIELACSFGAEYVLKCRTDHVFKCDDIINKLFNYMNKYPIANTNQKSRIVIPNSGTTLEEKWGTHHISDFWSYGHVDDLIRYFDINNPYWDRNKEINYMTPFPPAGKPFPSPEPEFCNLWLKYENINLSLKDLLTTRFAVHDVHTLEYSKHAKDKVEDINECVTLTPHICPLCNGKHMDGKTVHQKIWESWL